MKNVAITVPLAGAKSPQLRKINVSQKTTATTNGLQTMVVPCSYINQRACLERRAGAVEVLYAEEVSEEVIAPSSV